MLKGKRIILGVTGSIAAVKAPMLARELMRAGAEVHCAMTESAEQFATATAMAALTRNDVVTSVFPRSKAAGSDVGTWHVHAGRAADLMLIAPCSATTIGKLAGAIYDNPVTLLAACLKPGTPLVLVPAMDEEMWLQPVLQDKLEYLRSKGVLVMEPVSGALASGLTGLGRMAEPQQVVQWLETTMQQQHPQPLAGKRVLITGGPTYEPIDPVRFLGNRSSGKMAVALANAASKLGAQVTLIMGPSSISTNGHIDRVDVETASEMLEAVNRNLGSADIIVMNAAVSDFAPAEVSAGKLKKREQQADLTLTLQPTPDILREISKTKRPDQILVGFALETGEKAEAYAMSKLAEKNLDLIVLNRADETGAGFGSETNRITLYFKNGTREALPLMTKAECAEEIFSRLPKTA